MSAMQPTLAPAPAPVLQMQGSGQILYEDNHDQNLREQLLAQVHSPQVSNVIDLRHPDSTNPHDDHNNIDPAIAGPSMGMMGLDNSPDSGGDDKKGGKRELSTSKRAAQNRAAQRAFRQRKEGYIKKLEEQVKDYKSLAETLKASQAENYQLRDYIINLQSRLIETQCDFPPAPSNIDLHNPHPINVSMPGDSNSQQSQAYTQQHVSASNTSLGLGASTVSQLQASAAQGLAQPLQQQTQQQQQAGAKHHRDEAAAYISAHNAHSYPSKRIKNAQHQLQHREMQEERRVQEMHRAEAARNVAVDAHNNSIGV
ncbi:MAG: hypothetical protein M1829_004296 [Trizodia sp. TS-e1964]|nr:MAG: hypothetical protein M1829_004296 [Trizodia sp. TS-e1964]